MGMTLNEIKLKIGRRVGDPDLETYSLVVQDYFEQAFAQLLKQVGSDYMPAYLNEIRPSLALTVSEPLQGNDQHVSEIGIIHQNFPSLMRIYAVDSALSPYRTFRHVDSITFDAISRNTIVAPEAKEGYWCMDGQVIKVFLSTSTPYKVRIKYIKNPEPTLWTGDLIDIGYGYGFIMDCIELAAQLLRRQIGVEE